LAVRAALGAGRGGLVRQLLAETLLLSLIGGAVGLALARIGIASLTSLHPQDLPQLGSIEIDWRVLAFTLLVSLVTSLLFGLAPALTGTQLNLLDALKQGGRSATSGASRGKVLWLVLRQALEMATIGAAIGLCGAWASQKLTSDLLFGISPVDPLTFAAAGRLLACSRSHCKCYSCCASLADRPGRDSSPRLRSRKMEF
jgi:ABC-type antimicrobial peptide transport system permease subunit